MPEHRIGTREEWQAARDELARLEAEQAERNEEIKSKRLDPVSLGPSFGVVQNVVAVRQRATATALLFVCLNVLALGGGALFTGFVIDQLAQSYFVHGDAGMAAAIARALADAAAGGGAFRAACPGGAAPAGAAAELARSCTEALAHGSRVSCAWPPSAMPGPNRASGPRRQVSSR
jgi:hypothetical protein